MFGLYVHIPFCRRKCRYCDFVSQASREPAGRYLDALRTHMRRYSGTGLSTVFVGGGTPTVLGADDLGELLRDIRKTFDCRALTEITVEANPESLTDEVCGSLVRNGANRLSIGCQSFSDAELESLGRVHTVSDFSRAYSAARRSGMRNINIDLMYGLPSQSLEDWKVNLDRALSCGSEHLSLYPLTVEPGTPFFEQGVRVSEDLQAEMYEYSMDALESAGYGHYEISNWAKPGFEARHNLTYWQNREYIGIGAAAASYYGGVRSKNIENIEGYIAAVNSGKDTACESERIDDAKRLSEEMILKLRCRAGIERAGAVNDAYGKTIDDLVGRRLLEQSGRTVRLTRKGLLLANQVMKEFV